MFGYSFADIVDAYAILSPAITLAVCGFLAIVVIYKNSHKEINRVFFLWMLISALNALFYLMGLLLDSPFSSSLADFISLLDPSIALHFILLFSFGRKWIQGKWTATLLYVPVPFVILAMLVSDGLGINPVLPYVLYMVGLYLIELFSIGLLAVTFFKKKDKTLKMQLIFISVGIVIMTGGFYLTIGLNFFVPLIALLLGSIIVPLASILLAFTVLRFRLLGVEEVIKKGIVFSLLSFIMVTIFILVGEGLEQLFEDMTVLGFEVPGILAAVIIALLIIPLQGRLEKIINKIYPKKEDEHIKQIRLDTYRTALKDALADEKLTRKEKRLLNTLRDSLEITAEEDEQLRNELTKKG